MTARPFNGVSGKERVEEGKALPVCLGLSKVSKAHN